MAAADKPDAVALIKADHRKVEALFEKFESASGKSQKERLAQQICKELTIHTVIEEEIFYPACKGKVEDDLLAEAYVEHDAAKVLIAEIEEGGPDEQFYDAKVKVLSEEIQHHVKEEEKPAEGVLAQARKAGLDMDVLGRMIEARKLDLMAEIDEEGLPPPETRSFKSPDLDRGQPVDEPPETPNSGEDRPGAR